MATAVRAARSCKAAVRTQRVVIVHDDGTRVEAEVTPRLAAELRRMGWAEEKAEKRHRRRQKTETDLGVNLSGWEGPRLSFGLLLGASRTWDGPGKRMVEVDGQKRCRGCGQFAKMPAHAYCIEDGCDRCGREWLIPSAGER